MFPRSFRSFLGHILILSRSLFVYLVILIFQRPPWYSDDHFWLALNLISLWVILIFIRMVILIFILSSWFTYGHSDSSMLVLILLWSLWYSDDCSEILFPRSLWYSHGYSDILMFFSDIRTVILIFPRLFWYFPGYSGVLMYILVFTQSSLLKKSNYT